MSEIQRALDTLQSHASPKNCHAISELREALNQEIKYWGADYLHGEVRQYARVHHAQKADAHWKAAADLFKEKK